MTKKPLFWLFFCLSSLLCLVFSWQFFTSAFPFFDTPMAMSSAQATQAARTRASALKLAPVDANSAVRFYSDEASQNFMELEGGGKDAYLHLLNNEIYPALRWEVRFFREKDANLTQLYFSPQGKALGFARHLAEKEPGAALGAVQARQLAEAVARKDWGVDVSPGHGPYQLAEQSFKQHSNGRIDHQFIYERSDQRLGKNGEGRIRLTLDVTGEHLSGLHYSMKIPSSFERRFAEMRSANNTISFTASLLIGVLYFGGGCIAGLLLLQRQHFILSRPAIKWGAFIAVLQAGAALNQIPLSWFHYDTAFSANTFLAQQIGLACMSFAFTWMLLTVSFMAAEGLTRKAFGEQPQLWRLWQRGHGNSVEILGRTIGGYLWVGFDLAFIAAFYYVARNYFGWWSPLSSLAEPNILAAPMPWLEPVANALHAGFWEECLFRALPLAGAALLGDYVQQRFGGRLGGRRAWVLVALVLQALIFGAAHANYAQQPSYARPAELFLPAIVWGVVYLRYGLLPGIVFHYVFDLLLMSLPLFAMQAPGLGFDRAMVIFCGALPLLVVLWSRWRAGQWQSLPAAALNASWQAPISAPLSTAVSTPTVAPQPIVPVLAQVDPSWLRRRRLLPVLGIVGLLMWFAYSPLQPTSMPLYLERAEALLAAENALLARGIKLGADWQRFSLALQKHPESVDFVWREGGASAYAKLLGTYLPPPMWKVRFVRLSGEVAERAEEWEVGVENGRDGKAGRQIAPHIRYIEHHLPEARAEQSLAVAQARLLAHDVLRERFQFQPSNVVEVSAEEIKRPNRKDWRFTFADRQNFPLKIGEARIQIDVAGAEVSFAGRYVHVPEEWQRKERERGLMMKLMRGIVMLAVVALATALGVAALKRSFAGQFHRKNFVIVASIVFVLEAIKRANAWQSLAMEINTTDPLASQLWVQAGSLLLGWLALSLLLGMLAGIATYRPNQAELGAETGSKLILPSIALACLYAGLSAGFSLLNQFDHPPTYNIAALNQVSPMLAAICNGAIAALSKLALLTCALRLLHAFNGGVEHVRDATWLLFVAIGFMSGTDALSLQNFVLLGVTHSMLLMSLYLYVARYAGKVLILAMLPSFFAQINHAVYAPTPDAALHAGLYMLAVIVVAVWWMRLLERESAAGVALSN